MEKRIDWEPIGQILLSRHPTGKSDVGNSGYPPLILLKAVLQSWLAINSDPKLENQVNDRISFKVFMGIPLAENAPDHSIICRFLKRIGHDTLERIHHEHLQQLKRKGFSIESGMAVDAKLVKSASRAVSEKKFEKLQRERKTKSETDDTHPPKFMP